MTCADCHGGHDVQSPNEPRARVTQICGSCHADIFNEHTHAVHSLTPTGEGDDLVCTDCHGVHDIGAPNTPTYRNRSPGLCVDCHVDGYIVGKPERPPPPPPPPTLSPQARGGGVPATS
ncbi:MAG: cytochrome c3 family protein [Chloroflexi bacterium]|nr:cytochrome c3 family protein [Chloroflexota bacterium]